jgi:RimJ/RimL family protein N-acetyltransferase
MSVLLHTERLILRPPVPEDAEAACALMADPEVARWLTPDGRPQDKAAAWRGFAGILGHWQMRGFGFFTVLDRRTGEFIGRVGPWAPEGWPGIECGWTLARRCWGMGYAREAAIAAIAWTFAERPELSRIISLIDPRNVRSQSVARNVGETRTNAKFEFLGVALDVWAAERVAWRRRFV